MPGAQCVLTPANPVAISANAAANLTITLNVPDTAALTVADPSGQPSHTLELPLAVKPDF